MKSFFGVLCAVAVLAACSKGSDRNADDYSLEGTYKFAGSYTKIYDTVRSGDILISYEYTVSTSNHLGTLTFTAGTITRKGLVYDHITVRNVKETNLTTGAVIVSSLPTLNGQIGNISDTHTSNYNQAVPGSKLLIESGNYLFSPSYTAQPADKLYGYSFINGVLKITYEGYEAQSRMRNIQEATFTKQ